MRTATTLIDVLSTGARRRLALGAVVAAAAVAGSAAPANAFFAAGSPCQFSGVQADASAANAAQPINVQAGFPVYNSCGGPGVGASVTQGNGERSDVGYREGRLSHRSSSTRSQSSTDRPSSEPAKPRAAKKRRCATTKRAKAKRTKQTRRARRCARRR